MAPDEGIGVDDCLQKVRREKKAVTCRLQGEKLSTRVLDSKETERNPGATERIVTTRVFSLSTVGSLGH